jgi:hypothetical protein
MCMRPKCRGIGSIVDESDDCCMNWASAGTIAARGSIIKAAINNSANRNADGSQSLKLISIKMNRSPEI